MISTLSIKQAQLTSGYFTVGSGKEVILIMGSCRVAPYINYLNDWNASNRFTIHSLDPFNFNWDINDERVDFEEALVKWETDEGLLKMIKSVDYFIHEYYANAGMFNVFKEREKTIYQFGMNPRMDICLPNFNDYFILFTDIVAFDPELRKKAVQDFNVIGKLSEQTQKDIREISQKNLQKFYDVCRMSSFPDFVDYFKQNFRTKRMWYTYNHVSKNFTLAMFAFLNDNYLKLIFTDEYWYEISKQDMFASGYITPVTEYDLMAYGYKWGEEIGSLKEKIM